MNTACYGRNLQKCQYSALRGRDFPFIFRAALPNYAAELQSMANMQSYSIKAVPMSTAGTALPYHFMLKFSKSVRVFSVCDS